jgi:hypothetical protein
VESLGHGPVWPQRRSASAWKVLRTKKIVLFLRVPGDHIFYWLKGECPVTSQVDEEVVTTRERGGSRVLHVPLH